MKRILFFAGACFLLSSLSAQNQAIMEEIYDAQALTIGQAVYLIMGAAGTLPPDATKRTAFDAARAKPYGKKLQAQSPDAPATRGDFALLCMEEFKLSGGLNYILFRNRRYATRSMVAFDRMAVGHESLGIRPVEALAVVNGILEEK